jgi:hypothetical protein
MSKEDFLQWAMAVVIHDDQNSQANLDFIKQVEEHDKEAAALARKTIEASMTLAKHLKSLLEKQG